MVLESQQQTGQPSISYPYFRAPSVIDLTGEDDSPNPMDSNITIAGPSTSPATISEPDAAQTGKRQRQDSCNSNANEKEPRKRTRKSTRLKSRSNLAAVDGPRLETPIPRIHSDIVGVTSPKARPLRKFLHSKKWLDSEDDGADDAAVPVGIPVQPPRSPPQAGDKVGQHGAGNPEDEAQSMRNRIVELEKERDEYHERVRKQAATSGEQGQQLLLMRVRMEAIDLNERVKQYKQQLLHRDSQIDQLQKEIKQLRAPLPKRMDDQVIIAAQDRKLIRATDKSIKVRDGCLDEDCSLSAQGVPVGSRKDLAMRDLAGLRGSMEEQKSDTDRTSSSKQCEKDIASAVERENMNWATRFDVQRREAEAKLENATSSLLQENKTLKEKVTIAENDISQLQDENKQLSVEVATKKTMQDQISRITTALVETKEERDMKEKESNEKITVLQAEISRLQDVDCAKRRFETATFQTSISVLNIKLEKRAKEIEELRDLLRGADTKIDLLKKRGDTAVESSKTALQEEKAKHEEERRLLEDQIKKLRLSRDEAAAVMLKRSEEATQFKGEVDALRLALTAKKEEETRLQSQFKNLAVKIESLTTANGKYEAALQNERARHTKHTETLEAKVNKLSLALDDTEALKTEVDKLNLDLNADTKAIKWLENHARNLEAKIEALKITNRDEAAIRLQEREKYTKDIEALEATARTQSLALDGKGQEETRLQAQLREARDRIVAINTMSLNQEAALNEQKAHIDALNKELSELRHKASVEQVRTEDFNAARKKVLELEAETRRLEEELIGAGQVRVGIQDASVRRISELETKMRELEEQTERQTQSLREAQEGNQEALAVKTDNVELRKMVEVLGQRLQQLETACSHATEYQQKVEKFLDHVRSQLGRKIEDERAPITDVEAQALANTSTMEGIGAKLALKLDYIEWELEWYKQRYDEECERRKAYTGIMRE